MIEAAADTRQRLAVSALIGTCEGLLKAGELNPSQRASLRLMVDDTRKAYGLPTKEPQERVA